MLDLYLLINCIIPCSIFGSSNMEPPAKRNRLLPPEQRVLATDGEFLAKILSFVVTHPPIQFTDDSQQPPITSIKWLPAKHYGRCGQSCVCCRAMNPEDWFWSGCEMCVDGWFCHTVSKSWRATLNSVVRASL